MPRKAGNYQVLTLELIEARCTKCGDCWECKVAKTEHGKRYPQVKHAGKHMNLRRLAYELAHGSLRPSLRVVPGCDNPYCLNPAHQKALTESQKMTRAAKRGVMSTVARRAKIAAAKQAVAKITREQAMEIRESSESGPVLAARYGIDKSRVNAIKRGEAWRDFSSPFAGLLGAWA